MGRSMDVWTLREYDLVRYQGQQYLVLDTRSVARAKGYNFTSLALYNCENGERERLPQVKKGTVMEFLGRAYEKSLQFLYAAEEKGVFMDEATFATEELPVTRCHGFFQDGELLVEEMSGVTGYYEGESLLFVRKNDL